MSKITQLYTIDFSIFKPEALDGMFEAYKAKLLAHIDTLVAKGDQVTVEDLYGEESYDLDLFQELTLGPAGHLAAVADTPEFRAAYDALLPKQSELSTMIMQNEDLYNIYKRLHDSPEFKNFTTEQQTAIQKSLLAYTNSGVGLDAEKKAEYAQLTAKLSELQAKYGNNLLDARQAWSKLVTDVKELDGLPQTALDLLQFFAQQRGQEGYLLTLDPPAVSPVLKYAKNRTLRKEVYEAYAFQASPLDSTGGKYDNTELTDQIYQLKQQIARLIGYNSYAELSLSTKMAESPAQVLDFLHDLRDRALAPAKALYNTIKEYAKEKDGLVDFERWDIGYYQTMYGIEKYALDPEEVRKYFPAEKVLDGLFQIVEKLYGLKFEIDESVTTYHPDVKFLRGYENGKLVAGCYLDMYARNGKRAGAWMDQAFGRSETDTRVKLPVAYVNGNFNPPINGKSALLTHDEVTTLFHEFGHALHLLLTKTKVQEVCGTNVEWDAVELPSQIHENWCYEVEALKYITSHVDTGATMPAELVEKLRQHKEFDRSALFLTRQLEFGLFDMELFSQPASDTRSVKEIYTQVYNDLTREINGFETQGTFPNTFAHIFAGGYSAGYFSYLWADVLASDAFEAFLEAGDIFDPLVATAFKDNILAMGGTRPSMDNYVSFRGRKPDATPLLKSYGL